MGPWEWLIVAGASLAGAFFAVMGFRGLIDALDRSSGRCTLCGRTPMLPLSPTHECRHCHQRALSLHPFSRRVHLHN
jgi:hypothetical protein